MRSTENPRGDNASRSGDGREDHAFAWRRFGVTTRSSPLSQPSCGRTSSGRATAFPLGRRVLLDLYGTNHDPRVWKHPLRFDPERFLGPEPSAFAFVPTGGW